MNLDFNKKVSIIIIWLFHLSGLIGLLYIDKNLFASLTPLNLFISTTLLFVNQTNATRIKFFIVFTIFFVGMIAEILGVQYGLIFGNYDYGNNLGLKLLGVPADLKISIYCGFNKSIKMTTGIDAELFKSWLVVFVTLSLIHI